VLSNRFAVKTVVSACSQGALARPWTVLSNCFAVKSGVPTRATPVCQPRLHSWVKQLLALLLIAAACGAVSAAEHLPGTAPLALPQQTAEIVQVQLKQVRDYFLQRIRAADKERRDRWQPDFTSREAYERSLDQHRIRCRSMLGLEESRLTSRPAVLAVVAAGKGCRLERVSLPLATGISARGLLLVPAAAGRHPVAILCPDADTWPERCAGLLEDGRPPPWLQNLVAQGIMVYLAQSIERLADHPYCTTTRGKDRRSILYRLGYPVGRTMIGLDVQDVLAALDYLSRRPDVLPDQIGLLGIGQGGLTALYTAALDRRVRATVVADSFDCRERCWQEPVDRRLPGQLLVCGDAELAALVAPRSLGILTRRDTTGDVERLAGEIRRARRFFEGVKSPANLKLMAAVPAADLYGRGASLLADLLQVSSKTCQVEFPPRCVTAKQAESCREEHFTERLRHLRELIGASEARRYSRWAIASRQRADFPRLQEEMLAEYHRLVGEVPTPQAPLRPRTELVLATKKYKAYRVLLDVTAGIEMYGNLLVPEGIRGKTAAVVCQHGLSGTPEMITGLGQTRDTPYHEFGRRLAERGYVVFAPLLLHYHPVEWTNEQVRLAEAVGLMRVSVPVAKTRRVVDFLQSLPFVDPQQIGYYGLSYGGYSALWIAPLEKRLAAVVVSGHFNDWRSKITCDTRATSYLLHPDEDFYNWDVLNRFTHVEFVTMTAPRAVCIEYGTRDGITTPEWTAYAWKQLAAIRDHLGLKERIILAQFEGVHEVRCEGSFDFLDRFLRARPEKPSP
jgi:dienelactone hydrolase